MSGFAEYDNFDGLGLGELVRRGDVSAAELLDEAIDRTERVNGEINAVIDRFYEEARRSAASALPRGPFSGVPFLLKDLNVLMKGTVTSNGSAMWRGAVAAHDSTLVTRYREAGLVIFGKTNSPELGLQPVTEPHEFKSSRNPWNIDRTPGGSSGGAAAAVAAGILPIAHASDGGGSIRIPASCCGLVGLKPSRGRIPQGPDRAEGWAGQSTSHVVSRSVRDTAAMLDATAGSEAGDPYSAPLHSGRFVDAAAMEPGKLRIAFSRAKWGQGNYQDDAVAGLDQTVALLEGLGHRVVETRPNFDGEAAGAAMFTIICVNTALATQQRAKEVGCSVDELDMEAGTRLTMAMGNAITAADYAQAIQTNQSVGRVMGEFHLQHDVLLAPTLSSPPVAVGYISEAPPEEYGNRLFSYMGDNGIYNQTGQPSISLPLHWSLEGLPMGMMFSAAYGNDALLLRLAGQLEKAKPWWDKRAPLHATAQS